MTGARGWVLAAAVVLAGFFFVGLVLDAFAPEPQGPTGSSFATTSGGVAAWAELLSRAGHPVDQLRVPLGGAQLRTDETVVILGAGALTSAEKHNLITFLSAGGRLVIGGGDPSVPLSQLVSDPPRWTSAGPTEGRPAADVPEVAGVTATKGAGDGAWTSGPGVVALRGTGAPNDALLIVRRQGSGRLEMLADPSPLENQLLASADNAQLALDLAGPQTTPVVFAEALHGYGEASGLGAIPARWWLMFGGLLLAAAAWALSRGRRLGPAEPPETEGPPPRSAYVAGMAGMLIRARDPKGVEQALAKREANTT